MDKIYINNTKNYYTKYFIDDKKRNTIIVSAGGGYLYTSPRESYPVAKAFNDLGYHVAIINYRETKEDKYPLPQKYFSIALNEILKDDRIESVIGLGFSAGGHNILEVALHHKEYNIRQFDLLMLGYPVITSNKNYWHEGSFKNLLLDDFNNEKLLKRLSLENEVNKDAPSLFLFGTYTDESVNVMNSILLIEAYKKLNLNAEYHMFYNGGHGLSVANELSAEGNNDKINPYFSRWVNFADEWIKAKLNK